MTAPSSCRQVSREPPEDGSLRPDGSARSEGLARQQAALQRILLATDLTPTSDNAADEAVRLAVSNKAELIVLSVIDPDKLLLPGGRFSRRIDQERTQLEARAQAIVTRTREAGSTATFMVWEGDPAETILAASEAEGADVIVLGSHGRGRVGRLILGSVSDRVSRDASCPVLVIPS